PVRRPIAYIAGTVSRDKDGNPNTTPLIWTEAAATYADLSIAAPLDGRAVAGTTVVLTIAAGPSLYMVNQAVNADTGVLTGMAQVMPVSSADHTIGTALPGSMTG